MIFIRFTCNSRMLAEPREIVRFGRFYNPLVTPHRENHFCPKHTSDTIIVTFFAFLTCATPHALRSPGRKKALEKRIHETRQRFFLLSFILCDFDGIKQQTACVRWWWCRGWWNKIGFNWQVIGKMPRSTENKRKTLIKTMKNKENFEKIEGDWNSNVNTQSKSHNLHAS